MAGNSQQAEQGGPDAREPEEVWIDVAALIGGLVIMPGLILSFVVYVLMKL